MSYRGWVYIITNRAFPDLIKIGFSLKDPSLRAIELNHTGVPYPYRVEYEVMVGNPREIEQRAHRSLSNMREGKEWFRCSIETGVEVIRKHIGNQIILENLKTQATMDSKNMEDSDKINKPKRLVTVKKYSGNCKNCRKRFTVTLTHHDTGAACPNCFKFNPVSFK